MRKYGSLEPRSPSFKANVRTAKPQANPQHRCERNSEEIFLLFCHQPNYEKIGKHCNLWRNYQDIQVKPYARFLTPVILFKESIFCLKTSA